MGVLWHDKGGMVGGDGSDGGHGGRWWRSEGRRMRVARVLHLDRHGILHRPHGRRLPLKHRVPVGGGGDKTGSEWVEMQ